MKWSEQVRLSTHFINSLIGNSLIEGRTNAQGFNPQYLCE